MITPALRKWAAIGLGVGVEIGVRDLVFTVARVRPGSVRVAGTLVIQDYAERSAAEWGARVAAFLKECGAAHLAANVVLPRRDVIVRQIAVPGVGGKDLEGAVALQLDTLHPYPEDDVQSSWARLGRQDSVLVAIARTSAVERFANLFSEAGVRTGTFTVSPAAVYSAMRLHGEPDAQVAALDQRESDLEVYGESPARPLYSAAFAGSASQAAAVALAELRLPAESAVRPLLEVLPAPSAAPAGWNAAPLAYAAALAGACPWLALPLNLLPAPYRSSNSRAMFIPTLALATVLALILGALAISAAVQRSRYRESLQAEIRRLETDAQRVTQAEREVQRRRARTVLLDQLRRTPQLDLDAMQELTTLLAPPGWLNSLDLTRSAVSLAGEAEQAAGLLRQIDNSPYFRASEFLQAPARVQTGEVFRIRAQRETPAAPPAPAPRKPEAVK